jgi:hypothetical protein
MAHGVTLLMRNIRRPAPIVIARHVGAPRRVRRSRRSEWKGSYVTNYPYVNPARDARPGRRIRSDS